MMSKSRLPILGLLLASACAHDAVYDAADEQDPSLQEAEEARKPAGKCAADAGKPTKPPTTPPSGGGDTFAWKTDEFELAPGQERYLCFTKTVDDALVVNGYSTPGASFVHHLIFAKDRGGKEPLGFQECDTAFRFNWDPLFITGAGAAKLDFPSDAGVKIPKGTKLLVQMHLLNTSDKPQKGAVQIDMRRSTLANPKPVASFYLGNPKINLPPNQPSQLIGDCKTQQNVKLIAGFPHMHMLGTSMTVEVGSSTSDLKEVFRRDPYSFHNQTIEPMDLEIKAGSMTRVTCKWNNNTPETVTYGESTKNEMCYFIGFAVGGGGACLTSLPPGLFGPEKK